MTVRPELPRRNLQSPAVLELMSILPQTVALRSATAADAAFLLDLFCESRRDEVAGWGWTPEQQGLFLEHKFSSRTDDYTAQHPTAEDHIVCMGSEPIGRILTACEGNRLFLLDMALLERYSHRGIGGALLESLIAQGHLEDLIVSLEVVAGSRAERLCRRLGFLERCRESGFVRMEREPAPTKQLPN